jgi:hypothetical protein
MNMRFTVGKMILATLAVLALGACGGGGTPPAKAPTPILEPPRRPVGGHEAGKHCFYLKEKDLSIEASLTYDPNATAEGFLRGTQIDPADGYETTFNTSFTGRLVNDTLILQVTSDASGSRAATEERWVWKDSSLVENGKVLRQQACR